MCQPDPLTGCFRNKSGTVAGEEAAARVEGSRVIRPRQPTSWSLLGANECRGWGEARAGWSWGNPPIYPAGLILKAPEQSKHDWKMKKRPAGQRFLEVTIVSRRKSGPSQTVKLRPLGLVYLLKHRGENLRMLPFPHQGVMASPVTQANFVTLSALFMAST